MITLQTQQLLIYKCICVLQEQKAHIKYGMSMGV